MVAVALEHIANPRQDDECHAPPLTLEAELPPTAVLALIRAGGTRAAGLTATPLGPLPVATVAGLLGESAPPAPTSYWKTLSRRSLAT